jgi:hypothetical protein
MSSRIGNPQQKCVGSTRGACGCPAMCLIDPFCLSESLVRRFIALCEIESIIATHPPTPAPQLQIYVVKSISLVII